ncbi:MAG: hypothetical protein IPM29_26365 [Planctomycetes bacterium]|nr:hypothetical protein [Planctomycetota bacterium]
MIDGPVGRRFVLLTVVAALLLRVFASMLTGVPDERAVDALWQAERLAAGDATPLWGGGAPGDIAGVRPAAPLWPAAIAPLVLLGFDAFRSAQLLAAILGAVAIPLCVRLARPVASGVGERPIALLWIVAPLAVRDGAAAGSAPLFQLLVALALVALALVAASSARAARHRALPLLGVAACVALATLTRAEGVALVLVAPLAAGGGVRWRTGFAALAGVGTAVAALALGRLAGGLPALDPGLLPAPMGGRADPFAFAGVGRALLTAPLTFLAECHVLGALAVLGIVAGRRERSSSWSLVGLGCALVLVAGGRGSFVAWLPCLAPLAARGVAAIDPRGRLPILLVAGLASLLLSLRLQPSDWIGERTVGAYLARRLAPGEHVTGDVRRALYAAGEPPPPPRPLRVDELVDAARDPRCAYVVLDGQRALATPVAAALAGTFRVHGMPDDVRREAAERRLVVLERQR